MPSHFLCARKEQPGTGTRTELQALALQEEGWSQWASGAGVGPGPLWRWPSTGAGKSPIAWARWSGGTADCATTEMAKQPVPPWPSSRPPRPCPSPDPAAARAHPHARKAHALWARRGFWGEPLWDAPDGSVVRTRFSRVRLCSDHTSTGLESPYRQKSRLPPSVPLVRPGMEPTVRAGPPGWGDLNRDLLGLQSGPKTASEFGTRVGSDPGCSPPCSPQLTVQG